MAEQICERCSRGFDFPETGAQPESGEWEGVPLCADCLLAIDDDDEGDDGGAC